MTEQTRIYSEKEILAFANALEPNEDSFKWLMANNCIELAAACDVIVYNKESARDWLEKNGYNLLTEFINALDVNDDDDFSALMNESHKEWAAVVDFVNESKDTAMLWLLKSNLKHFGALATVLASRLNKSSGSIGGFGFGFGFGSGGGIGGGGFSGFGGGSFGGGGASGSW